MIVLTDRQRAALEVRGASVALASGAGCGKTSVLTERFLLALDEHDDGLAALVALTFTEKAARELRGRVRAEGRRRLQNEEDDPSRWRAVLRGLEAAPIGTFHGFCQGLLSRFPIEAGLEPDFGILEDVMAPAFRRRAIDRVLRAWLSERRHDLVVLGVEYGLERVRRHLDPLVANHGPEALLPWSVATEEEIVERWRDAWEDGGRAGVLQGLVDESGDLLTLLTEHPCRNAEMRRRADFLLEHLPNLANDARADARLAALIENAQVQGAGKKTDWPSEDIFETIKRRLTRFREAARKRQDALVFDEEAAVKAAALGLRFARLACEARQAYDEAKALRGLLDFDDLLRHALRLIDEAEGRLAAELARSARFVLVDEFQDTDATQGAILERLAGAELAAGRLFLVGDSKQSIYRFRGAEPRIFDAYRDRFPAAGRKDLTENFRGLPDVLDFVNTLFHDTFPSDPPLEAGPSAPARDGQPHVHFLWASDAAGSPNDDDANEESPNVEARRQTEAAWLARWLAAKLEAGWTIYDRRARGPRLAAAGDVALLFRTLNDARFIERALVEVGLDYHEVGGAAFYSRREIIDIVNVLAAIDDPLDAPALAAALRGPYFNLSDEALFWLAERRDMAGLGDFVAGFEAGHVPPRMAADDRERLARARGSLRSWRAARDHVPLADLVARVLAESGHEAALMADGPLGPRRHANLRKLVALARGYDRQGGWTLADLVTRLRTDVNELKPPREEEAATTEEASDSVRLMTIHQAKGLEFPIVVLPDLNRAGGDTTAAVVLDPELGMLVRPASAQAEVDPEAELLDRPHPGWTLHQRRERVEEEREALRVFYVATTRAETHLVLSAGFHPRRDRPKSPALRLLATRFDLENGTPRAEVPEATSPRVEVVTAPPPEPATPRARRPRVDRLALAAHIREAAPLQESTLRKPIRPRYVELDPARCLAPTAARVDRLVRAALAGPPRGPDHVAREGRRQVPAASPRIVARAEARIRLWLERDPEMARALGRASGLVRAWTWRVAWPDHEEDATVFLGRAEFLLPRRDKSWSICLVSDPGVPEPWESLRLQLAARAAERAGFGPVTRGRVVRLGDGSIVTWEEVSFHDDALIRSWRAFVPTAGAGFARLDD